MDTFATVFAGLGLFFIGLNSLTKAMRSLTSRGVHSLIQNATSNSMLASFFGILLGAATQSSTAVTFIAASMASSGVIALSQSMLITAWSNLGATLLVFLATIDIHIYLYFFIGFLGLAYYFGLDKTETRSKLISLFVGLAVLMLGIQMIKLGASAAGKNEMIMVWLSSGPSSLILLFGVGILMSLATQSATSVSAIVVALVAGSIFDFYQAAGLILGANLGVAVSVFLLGRRLSGNAKRVVLLQGITKVLGVVGLLPLFIWDIFTGASFLSRVLCLNDSILLGTSLLVLVIQVTASVCVSAFIQRLAEWLSKHIEDDATDELRIPQYIHSLALEDSESAIDLLEKEHFRVISVLPVLLEDAKKDPALVSTRAVIGALDVLIHQCDQFCIELINRNQNAKTLERILKAQHRNSLLSDISHNLKLLLEDFSFDQEVEKTQSLKEALYEGLHFILMFFDDAKHTLDDLDAVLIITGDKSSVMERVREELVAKRDEVGEESLTGMLSATSKFERLIWLINSYCLGLRSEVALSVMKS